MTQALQTAPTVQQDPRQTIDTLITGSTTPTPAARPTVAEVRDLILRETAAAGVMCGPKLAEKVIQRLSYYADKTLKNKGALWHVSEGDMANGVHKVMDVIMVDHPVGAPLSLAPIPAAGTAHAALNSLLFDGSDGVLRNLVHTKDLARGSVYCATGVALHQVG